MKNRISFITILVLCVSMMLALSVSAAGASASLTGPDVVRAGDTITLSFKLDGSGIYGASGTLSYDTDQLTLSSTSQKIASPWMVEFNGNNFVAYDNNITNPINSTKTLFTVTFKVKNLAAGEKINVSYTDVTVSDGSADTKLSTVKYSETVAAPMSTNNNLASLTVSNATISPAFSASTTKYTASVGFEVSELKVSAKAADAGAKVSVNNPKLTPNATTDVTITVTSESGAKKTYTISVKRAQDPNYTPSENNDLSGITVEGFLLSPVFKADKTQYVVWAPYETESVRVSGTAADKNASVKVEGGDTLTAGEDNVVKIICTAENGEKKEYVVIVKRAAELGADTDVPLEPDPPIIDDTQDSDGDDGTSPDQMTAPETDKAKDNGTPRVRTVEVISWKWIFVAGLVAIVAGFGIGFFSRKYF